MHVACFTLLTWVILTSFDECECLNLSDVGYSLYGLFGGEKDMIFEEEEEWEETKDEEWEEEEEW